MGNGDLGLINIVARVWCLVITTQAGSHWGLIASSGFSLPICRSRITYGTVSSRMVVFCFRLRFFTAILTPLSQPWCWRRVMTQGELCLNKTQFENFTTIGQGLIRNELKCCKSRVKQCQLLSGEVKQFATLSLQVL